MNNVRGYLAEFLVARAVQAVGHRIEWDAFDVLTPDGVKVEVKASAYLQVWDQRAPSRIVFSGLRGKTWSPQQGEALEATYNADVYVFPVHTALRHDQYDALDVRQWEFYVLPRETIKRLGYKSLGLSTLRTITGEATPYGEVGHVPLDPRQRPRLRFQRSVDGAGATGQLHEPVPLHRGLAGHGLLSLGDLFVDAPQASAGCPHPVHQVVGRSMGRSTW